MERERIFGDALALIDVSVNEDVDTPRASMSSGKVVQAFRLLCYTETLTLGYGPEENHLDHVYVSCPTTE